MSDDRPPRTPRARDALLPAVDPNAKRWGKRRAERLAQTSLAIAIREMHRPEEAAWWLRCVMGGLDPDVLQADGRYLWQVCADEGRLVQPGTSAGYTPPDWTHRMVAKKMLDDRGHGQPAQHVVLEQEVRSRRNAALEEGDEVMAELTDAQLDVLRAVGELQRRSGAGVVIDASSTEGDGQEEDR